MRSCKQCLPFLPGQDVTDILSLGSSHAYVPDGRCVEVVGGKDWGPLLYYWLIPCCCIWGHLEGQVWDSSLLSTIQKYYSILTVSHHRMSPVKRLCITWWKWWPFLQDVDCPLDGHGNTEHLTNVVLLICVCSQPGRELTQSRDRFTYSEHSLG